MYWISEWSTLGMPADTPRLKPETRKLRIACVELAVMVGVEDIAQGLQIAGRVPSRFVYAKIGNVSNLSRSTAALS